MAPSVSLAAPHEVLPALRLLFPDKPSSEVESIGSAGLFVARGADERIEGAMMVDALPGALGLAFPPRAETEADSLVAAASDWLRERGVKVCQAFASTDEVPRLAPLERNGFRHITQLVSLRRELDGPITNCPLEFEEARPPFSEECRGVLLSTHEGTLDCPELNEDRSAAELIEDFAEMSAGATWHLARRDGFAVGAVILSPSAAENELELAYLGVVPGARRRGFGGTLVAFSCSEARRRGANAITVSVDSRNSPALELYRRNGFVETARREVWLARIRKFSPDSS
jgi:mycothiol synthase